MANLLSDETVSRYDNAVQFIERNRSRLGPRNEQSIADDPFYPTRGILLEILASGSSAWAVEKAEAAGWQSWIVRGENSDEVVFPSVVVFSVTTPVGTFDITTGSGTEASAVISMINSSDAVVDSSNTRIMGGANIRVNSTEYINASVWIISSKYITSVTTETPGVEVVRDSDRISGTLVQAKAPYEGVDFRPGLKVLLIFYVDVGYVAIIGRDFASEAIAATVETVGCGCIADIKNEYLTVDVDGCDEPKVFTITVLCLRKRFYLVYQGDLEWRSAIRRVTCTNGDENTDDDPARCVYVRMEVTDRDEGNVLVELIEITAGPTHTVLRSWRSDHYFLNKHSLEMKISDGACGDFCAVYAKPCLIPYGKGNKETCTEVCADEVDLTEDVDGDMWPARLAINNSALDHIGGGVYESAVFETDCDGDATEVYYHVEIADGVMLVQLLAGDDDSVLREWISFDTLDPQCTNSVVEITAGPVCSQCSEGGTDGLLCVDPGEPPPPSTACLIALAAQEGRDLDEHPWPFTLKVNDTYVLTWDSTLEYWISELGEYMLDGGCTGYCRMAAICVGGGPGEIWSIDFGVLADIGSPTPRMHNGGGTGPNLGLGAVSGNFTYPMSITVKDYFEISQPLGGYLNCPSQSGGPAYSTNILSET